MTGQPLRVVPVAQDRGLAALTGARLLETAPGRSQVAIVAGVTAGAPRRRFLTAGGAHEPLWHDVAAEITSATDLVRVRAAEIFCLAPGASLMRVAWQDDAVRCDEIAVGGEVPERLFAAGDTLFGVYPAGSGGRTVAVLRATGPREVAAGERLPAPPMDASSTISGLMLDRAGRIVLTADDPVTGFKLWRQADDGWTPEITDGAARFGANAAVHDVAVWGDLVVLTVGCSRAVLDRLFDLRFPGEILVLRPDGRHAMRCGETRTSRSGLMSPLAGQANAAARERGLFTRLARDGDALFAVMQRPADARIFRIGPGFDLSAAGEVEGVVADLAVDREGVAPLTVLTLGG